MEEWLKLALLNKEWVSTQKAAWEHWKKPECFGRPAPKFILLSEQNQ